MDQGIKAMTPGIVLLALTTSATIFLCHGLGTVDAADSHLLFGVEFASSQVQRHLLSTYKTVNRNSFATVSTQLSLNTWAPTRGVRSKYNERLVTLSPQFLIFRFAHLCSVKDMLPKNKTCVFHNGMVADTDLLTLALFCTQVCSRV